jgi:photosystem II stability/assembly factor-like uncharacterized protein/PKD repeat protein
MKKFTFILAIIIISSISYNLMAQPGWSSLSTSYTGNFKDVYFINTTTGFAVGGNNSTGVVYKTTNGGTSWSAFAISASSLESVWFTGSSVGYAVGTGGKIYKTTNGGTSWALLTSGTTTDLTCVQFLSATTGYAIGGTVMLKTTNSGTSWTSTTVPSAGSNTVAKGIYFTTTSNGVIYGSYQFFNGWINHTSNGGTTWTLPVNTYPGVINDVFFTSTTAGYAVGNAGSIYKTTNGGSSWLMKTSGYTGNLNAVYFVNSNIGYAVGDSGVVLKTTNGGNNWVRQITNIQNTLQGVAAPSTTVAFAVGDTNIIKTTSGGISLLLNTPNENVFCNGYVNLHAYTTYDGIGTLTYTWNASPYLSSTSDSVVTAGPLTSNQNFIVTVSDGTLSQIDTTMVSVIPLPTDSICIVAVDSLTDHPIVVFEKHIAGPIDYYKIYKESNVAGIYDSIGFLPADSAGVFIDTNANVQTRQYSYKISNVDSCGNESLQSAVHKTMHLQVNAGSGGVWNLMWTPYEGVFVQSYEIWRGADTINMAKIGTVPGTNVSFTDLNPPSGGLYYFVRIVSAYICQPYNYKANINYHTSRSNHANNGLINPPISADFNATPLNGNSPLNVQFTDITSSSPSTWKWYFGDGDTSTIQNPSHIYTNDGKYTVKLVVSANGIEDSIEKVDYITVGSIGFKDIDVNQSLKIYPNPLQQNNALFIDFEHVQITQVQLLNIVGKNMQINVEKSTNRIKLETANLSRGIYILKLTSAAGDILMRKIILK